MALEIYSEQQRQHSSQTWRDGTLSGALGLSAARRISEVGVAPGGSSNALEMTLAGTFCIPPTGTFFDTIAGLPGIGAIAAKGQLDLGGLLP